MSDLNIFATRLKEERENQNKTQKELSQDANITASSLSSYEKGLKMPSLDTAIKISKALNVSLDWLSGLDTKSNLSSYADLLELILSINEKLKINISLPKNKPNAESEYYPSITIQDKTLSNILTKWMEIRILNDTEVIDRDLYSLWVDKQLEIYKSTPINPPKSKL